MASIVIPKIPSHPLPNIPQPPASTLNEAASSPTGPSGLGDLSDVVIPKNIPYDGYVLTYDGPSNVWTPRPIPITRKVYLSISITGVMQPGEVLMQYSIPEAIAIPLGNGMQGSSAIASVAASNIVVATINKNSQQVGTVTWAAGSYIGIIDIPARLNLVSGDVLQLVAPASPDSSLANIGVTFACVRGG